MVHVEVVTHFNEDAFSYGLAHGVADRLRQALDGVTCTAHGEEPSVRVRTDGVAQTLNDLHVDVGGCCPEIVARVQDVVADVVDCD